MLLKLLVRIFIIILKSRWNSIALREPEYEGELSPPFPRALPISLINCTAASARAIDG